MIQPHMEYATPTPNLTKSPRRPRRTRLANEPFIGMWKDREDMKDSSAYIRNLREREWR
jgi:hypothetical protein